MRPNSDSTLRGILVELKLEFEWIKQLMIEPQVIDCFAALSRKMKPAFAIGSGGAQDRFPVGGIIRDSFPQSGRRKDQAQRPLDAEQFDIHRE